MSLAAMSKPADPCACGQAFFAFNRCVSCDAPMAMSPVIHRDPAAMAFGQTVEASRARLVKTGRLSRGRAKQGAHRRVYAERPGTAARDYQVIGLLAAGQRSRVDIARELGITAQGVWPIIKRAYRRLSIPLPAIGEVDHSVLIATARVRGVIA
jgi:DNA-binding CsgD family transcriptional regulator